MRTVGEWLRAAGQALVAAGIPEGRREAAWLLARAMDLPVSELRLHPERPVPPALAGRFDGWVQRRAAREPLQYILGEEEFLGMLFRVTPAVLIPRPATELLVRQVAERLRAVARPRVADIGTGSGCIAVGLCHLVPEAEVWAVDLSPAALEVARENAQRLGVAGRVHLVQGDLLDPLAGQRFHAIVSNPPYIPAAELETLEPEVKSYEPQLALSPGADGLAVVRRLVAGARDYLEPGGLLALEVGAGQGEEALRLLGDGGFAASGYRDELGHLRCLVGAVQEPPARSAGQGRR